MNYIDINQILFRNQYGFTKNHSTTLALINLYDKICAGSDANKHTVGIFLDLSKAFDTVDQWRSPPDNLVPLCKFEVIIIIHSLEIDCFYSQ